MAYACLIVGLTYPFFLEWVGPSSVVTDVAGPLYVLIGTVLFQYFTYTSLEDNPHILNRPPKSEAKVTTDESKEP